MLVQLSNTKTWEAVQFNEEDPGLFISCIESWGYRFIKGAVHDRDWILRDTSPPHSLELLPDREFKKRYRATNEIIRSKYGN